MNFKFYSALGFFLAAITAHPHEAPNGRSIKAHRDVLNRCGSRVAEMKTARRALRRRAESIDSGSGDTDYVIHAAAPNDGPYFLPRSQTLRQDIREGQPGVPLSLEIGVIDVDTCEPLNDVLVDIWHCNATGSYSSFTGLSPNTQFLELYSGLANGSSINLHAGLPDLSWLSTDNSTFLRGMWPTDKDGVTSFTTIFPGFYVQRAIHIHVQVYTNWTVQSNGTLLHGSIVSTGQIFADEGLSEEIMRLEPYVGHTEIDRVKNEDDGIYTHESATGAMTLMDTEPLDGNDYTKGIFGYITLGIQTTQIRNGSTVDALPDVDTEK